MCNLYDVGPSPAGVPDFDWETEVRQMVLELGLSYVAPAKPGIVVRQTGGDNKPAAMRWGFQRTIGGKNRAINNARDNKLNTWTWRESWRQRRCVIPVRQFYEWSGQPGKKTKHAVKTGIDEWMWIAGLWEDNPDIGPSFTMVTTSANAQIRPIHEHRMPAILTPAHVTEYLSGTEPPAHLIGPYQKELIIEDV